MQDIIKELLEGFMKSNFSLNLFEKFDCSENII